nr:immunoglobulin light chain junction region [Macaca mulatta]
CQQHSSWPQFTF